MGQLRHCTPRDNLYWHGIVMMIKLILEVELNFIPQFESFFAIVQTQQKHLSTHNYAQLTTSTLVHLIVFIYISVLCYSIQLAQSHVELQHTFEFLFQN